MERFHLNQTTLMIERNDNCGCNNLIGMDVISDEIQQVNRNIKIVGNSVDINGTIVDDYITNLNLL